MKTLLQSIKLLLVMTFLLGGVYPLVITNLGAWVFPSQSSGLLLEVNGTVIGAQNIGQNFSKAGYFIARPSSAGEDGYDALSSSGSNLAPTNKLLLDRIDASKEALHVRFGDGVIPSDLVMTSGSGLDPHISKLAALYQVQAIAKERQVDEVQMLELVNQYIERKFLGFIGEERVNVLLLNRALDKNFGVLNP
ncbi:potassium-transporting ATPase subunit KdpC [Sulfurospirillum multivorans]|uniref:Potassium-transporting ATPase KdpC subunit n=2 Tax=Sulfurospirillum multivorans TaxID=66821 RepID=A0AA86AR48_SULMK|nr:potassium-transporting ATPase subunit KdpC [Sulfurospirillum multivorans]AHJ14203.1 potassium-transporting ATPase C chain [Sulfurospirillum multivorans DSM 12446]QEH07688.1 potassium-transporting ATPase C chain [Sulfurospirillum multivorans]